MEEPILLSNQTTYQGYKNIGIVGLPPLGCMPFQKTLKVKVYRQLLVNENAQ